MKVNSGIVILIASLFIACSSEDKTSTLPNESAEPTLGSLQHKFELNNKTKDAFEEGLLLLHNFEYDDALTAFQEATAADSTEVMTHWGEAMCNYKALWRLQNMEKGNEILSRLGDTPEDRLKKITDPIEQALWQGLEIIFGEGEFDERNEQYTKHMAALHEKYPEHQEIAAFYALSLIWSTEEYGDGSEDLRLAASIADEILAVNPKHPGALHYKIHALDGPTSAKDAHKAADAYAKVAADAAHALHMPSHIYLALGEWEGVVNSNRVSYDASVSRMKKLALNDGARGYHSLAWLHYGLLQQGRYKEAEGILSEMLEHVPNDPTKGARGYLLGMQNRQMIEGGAIAKNISLDMDVKVDDIGILAKSMRSFLRAQIAAEQKDIKSIEEEIKWLGQQKEVAATTVEGDGLAMCAAGTSRYAPTTNSVMSCEVVINQMQALVALLKNDEQQFEKHMQQAVKIEAETNNPAGPPRISFPSFEQYGDWLLAKGKYAEAIAQFDQALERMPRRTKSLVGKMKALKALDQMEEAGAVEEELKAIWEKADKKALSVI